jgi:anti-anti-sigma factor
MRVVGIITATDLCVRVTGEIDLSNRECLRTALLALDYRSVSGVHLDLSGLDFCDGEGCELLLRFERAARRAGHPTEIRGASPALRKIFGLIVDRVETRSSGRVP